MYDYRFFVKFVKYKMSTHTAELLDSLYVNFVLLHLLPEPHGLLHLSRVDVFRPTTFHVINSPALCLEPFSVHLATLFSHV